MVKAFCIPSQSACKYLSGFALSWLQKIPVLFGTFQDPRNVFPGPCGKPPVFKYRDKHHIPVYSMIASSVLEYMFISEFPAAHCYHCRPNRYSGLWTDRDAVWDKEPLLGIGPGSPHRNTHMGRNSKETVRRCADEHILASSSASLCPHHCLANSRT